MMSGLADERARDAFRPASRGIGGIMTEQSTLCSPEEIDEAGSTHRQSASMIISVSERNHLYSATKEALF